jgi:hypothetical protein
LGNVFVIANGELILMETAAVAVGPSESFTWTVKLEVPCWVGTPEIAPVIGEMVSPAGSDPATTLHA